MSDFDLVLKGTVVLADRVVEGGFVAAVSYTHLTLPTIYSV